MSLIVILAPWFSGAEVLARLLQDRFGFRFVDDDVLIERAAAWGLPQRDLGDALHEPAARLGRRSRLRRTARALIRTALWAEVGSGNAVYCGNAGYLLAGAAFPVLRVRLTARMESRVDEACRRLALTPKEAAALIHHSDKRHERWRREVSGRDCEPDYDVSFRFEPAGMNAVAAAIASLAARCTARGSDAHCQEAVGDLVLASRVKAKLALDPATASMDARVIADRGLVFVECRSPLVDLDAVRRVASGVPGLSRLEVLMPAERRPFRPFLTGCAARRPQFATLATTVLIAFSVMSWLRWQPIQTFAGIVTDTQCAGRHASLSGDAIRQCIRKCVLVGDHVRYAVHDGNHLYVLSDQRAAEALAARQVKVTGFIDRRTNVLHVRSIRPTS